MFPVGIFIMSTTFGKQYLWTTTIFLGLEALIMFLVLRQLSGLFTSFLSMVIIFIISFFAEWWGVNTGTLFGNYTYTDVLQPKLFDVPVAIMFAWFTVSTSCLILITYIFKGNSLFTIALVSASLILASDILLEPFASFVNNFWMWESFKIPVQNFITWFLLGFIFSLMLSFALRRKNDHDSSVVKIPLVIIIINVLNFSIVNLANGYYVLTFIGLVIFGIIIIPAVLLKIKRKQHI
jgi:bisanhydrobacterioruberin hydratase